MMLGGGEGELSGGGGRALESDFQTTMMVARTGTLLLGSSFWTEKSALTHDF